MRRPIWIAVAVGAIAAAAWLWQCDSSDKNATPGEHERTGLSASIANGVRPIEDRTPSAVGGAVTDAETGRGIGGAVVSLTEKSLDGGSAGRPGETPLPITARTGADGRWSLPGLPAGRYAVAASARGYAPGTLDNVVVRPRTDRSDIDLALSPGGHALTGTVTDIGGGPIGGAVVRAVPLSDASFLNLPWANFAAVTGGDGRYELFLGDGVYAVEVRHADYRPDDRTTEIRGGPRTLDFSLVPGGVIHGRVLTRDGDHPVSGALVTETSGTGGFNLQVGINGVTTDDAGRFVMRGLKSGSLELRAVARGYSSTTTTPVEIGIGEQVTGVVVYVDEAHDISGYVVRKDDESVPVEGVLVGAYNLSPGALLASPRPSLSDGYFEILGVPKGSYVVGALGEELVPNFSGANVTIEDEDVTDVKVLMDAGVTLSGRVDPPGPAKIRIEMNPDDISMTNIMATVGRALLVAEADEEGHFELKAVTPGDITLAAISDDGAKGSIPVEVRYDDVDGLLIPMEPRPYVAGRVVDADGNPLSDARVQIRPTERGGTFTSMNLADMVSMGRGGQPTGEDGRFKVTGLDPGTHEVTVRDDRGQLAWGDRAHRKAPREPIEIEVSETPTENLTLVVETRDGVIRGLVVGPGGAPVADAWVTAQRTNPDWEKWAERRRERRRRAPSEKQDDEGGKKTRRSVTVSIGSDGTNVETSEEKVDENSSGGEPEPGQWSAPEQPVLTNAEGRFEIANLRDGTYTLEAEGLKGSAKASLEDVKLGADVVLNLETLSTLHGVVTIGGEPVANYAVEASGPTRRRTQAMNSEGRYELRRLEPGDYEVKVTSLRGSVSEEVTVAANSTKELDLKLVPYSAVYGTVVDSTTGEPMPGLVVFATSEGPMDMGNFAQDMITGEGPRTGPEGQFRVGKLAAGKGSVTFIDGDVGGFQLVASREFTLKAGQELDLGEIQGLPSQKVPEDERGWLGLETYAATWEDRPRTDANKDSDLPDGMAADDRHLWVSKVDEDGPAAAAGIERGDRITAVDGTPIGSDLAPVVSQLLKSRVEVGKTYAIELDRDGDRSTYSVEAVPEPEGLSD